MKIMTTLLSLLPVAALACSDGQPVDIGHTEAQLSDYAARWDGYAEAFTFETSHSDRIHLSLNPEGIGTLEVGEGPALPPPGDPSIGYPVESYAAFRNGFKYPVHGARIEAGRIRFGISPADVFGAWCALQTPVLNPDDGTYGCLPLLGESMNLAEGTCALLDWRNDVQIPVDCGKLALCLSDPVCTCTASACGPGQFGDPVTLAGYSVLVDAALEANGTSLVGTLVYDAQRITIRLQKQ